MASDGTQANAGCWDPDISFDGRYLTFNSYADNMVPGDTNNRTDIFVHDRQTGETSRVSVASDGTEGNGSSFNSRISPDGRYVVFASSSDNFVAGDTNGISDIFVHDRRTGEITRANVASDGTQEKRTYYFDLWAEPPDISSDGRYVTWYSKADNLVPGDTNNESDIFVHDRQTGRTTRVSVSSDGTQGNSESAVPSISGDGRYVSFYSYADNLVPGDTNYYGDVFVHHRQTGQTKRVSVALDGTQGNVYSFVRARSISQDGRYIAFYSASYTLMPGDANGSSDVFVVDFGPKYSIPNDIDTDIQALPDSCFKNNAKNRKKTFQNKLMEVQALMDSENYQDAIDKLTNDIKPKLDGEGNNDWIVCSDAQEKLTGMIDSLITYLQDFI